MNDPIFRSVMLLMFLAVGLTACATAPSSGAPAIQHTTAEVETHPSQGDVVPVEDAHAELLTTDEGATMTFRTTDLQPGNVYTAWWVVINDPNACADSPCVPSDILSRPDAVHMEVTYADGILVEEDGQGQFAGYLATGSVPEAWYDHGFTNPRRAEIHIVINDHGPLIPEMATTMLTSYRGGCTDESLPPPFPSTAKADGEPGPNTCRLVQDAIFQQQEQAHVSQYE
jgi:hypothetical protein